jgi:protein SCO1/2
MKLKQAHVDGVTTRDEARAWHLLTGTERSIAALARATGFRYGYDANTRQYAHPTGIVIVTPEGKIERYFPGLEFTSDGLRDALRGSARQPTASPADFVQLICFHVTAGGRYTASILDALRMLTASALAAGFIAIVRVRQRSRAPTKQ